MQERLIFVGVRHELLGNDRLRTDHTIRNTDSIQREQLTYAHTSNNLHTMNSKF